MIALFRTEWVKQVRRIRTYLVLLVVVVLPFLIAVGVHNRENRGDRGEADSLFFMARVAHSGIVVPAVALSFISGFVLVIVVSVFAGDSVASEASWGNLRYMLVRPISRTRLLASKLAIAFLFMFIATALISLTGLLAGVILIGWHPVNISLPIAGVEIHQTTTQLIEHLGVVTAYVGWEMASIVALGFMVSTMTNTPVGAIAAAAVFGIGTEILDQIPSFGSIRYVLPLHYLDSWTELIRQGQTNTDMIRGSLLQLAYVVVFCSIGFWWFRRKDVLS
jgi:ABC-2 type transport system permease protein